MERMILGKDLCTDRGFQGKQDEKDSQNSKYILGGNHWDCMDRLYNLRRKYKRQLHFVHDK
jgi:hypothetical protein